VTSEEAADLLQLRGLWPEARAITLADGVWTACRHDNPARVLTSGTAPGLRWQIRNDDSEWLRT